MLIVINESMQILEIIIMRIHRYCVQFHKLTPKAGDASVFLKK